MTSVREFARNALALGLCPLPIKSDYTKTPDVGSWLEFKSRRPTGLEIDLLFNKDDHNIAIVLGKIPDKIGGPEPELGLEVFDHENQEAYEECKELMIACGMGDLLKRFESGYLEKTPRGFHWLYRCRDVDGGTNKLARNSNGDLKIETRSTGHYIVIAPSRGKRNDGTDYEYKLISGGLESIPIITPQERQDLFALIGTLSAYTETRKEWVPASGWAGNARVGDVFNQRGNWDFVLLRAGYKKVYTRKGVTHWLRPGSKSKTSATTNHGGHNMLYMFSTSTVLEHDRGYRLFSAEAMLNHNGDFTAAARWLAQNGYRPDPEPISFVLADFEKTPPPEREKMPAHLHKAPGMVGEFFKYIESLAVYSQPNLSIGAALAATSTIIGRKVRTRSGLFPNIYVLSVADTGAGKSFAYSGIKKVFRKAGIDKWVSSDTVASDTAIMRQLSHSPSSLLIVDEFGRVAPGMLNKNAGSHQSGIITLLLGIYGSSDTSFSRNFADSKNDIKIEMPNLSVYACTVPQNFYQGITKMQVHDGLLPRFIVTRSDDDYPDEERDVEISDPPRSLIEQIEIWKAKGTTKQDNLSSLNPGVMVIEETPTAKIMLSEFSKKMHKLLKASSIEKDTKGIYSRSAAHAKKLAMIVACGCDPEFPRIDESAAQYAIDFVDYSTRQFLADIEENVADSVHEHDHKQLIAYLRRCGGELSQRELKQRFSRIESRSFSSMLTSLAESGIIQMVPKQMPSGQTKKMIQLIPE